MNHPIFSLRYFSLHFFVVAMLATVFVGDAGGQVASDAQRTERSGQLDGHIWSFKIRLSVEEYESLEPDTPQRGIHGPTDSSGQAVQPKSNRETVANLLGIQFPWVKGTLDFTSGDDSQSRIPCRIRYDGDFTYMFSARSQKRPMFIELLEGNTIAGLTSFRLHTMQFDQTMLRERIAADVFASVGANVTRAGHAELSLIVGQEKPQQIGLYTVLEAVDSSFLKRNNIPGTSLLVQTNGFNSIRYLGSNWAAYRALFRTNRPPDEQQKLRIIELTNLVSESTNEEFNAKIGEFFDTDSLLRYIAATSLTSNVTGMSTVGTNDFLCLDSKGKFHIVASQLETALGGAVLSGTSEQLANLRLMRPYAGECKLIDRLMNSDMLRKRYLQIVREAASGFFESKAMDESIASIETQSAQARERERKLAEERLRQMLEANGGGGGVGFTPPRADGCKNVCGKTK